MEKIVNAINIIYECDCNYRLCDYYKKPKLEWMIIITGKKRKVCVYDKYGECTNNNALKEAVKGIPEQWWYQ